MANPKPQPFSDGQLLSLTISDLVRVATLTGTTLRLEFVERDAARVAVLGGDAGAVVEGDVIEEAEPDTAELIPSPPGRLDLLTIDCPDSKLALGEYFYSVVAVGPDGKSVPKEPGYSATVGIGQGVALTVGGFDPCTLFLELYRSTDRDGPRKMVQRVAVPPSALGGCTGRLDEGKDDVRPSAVALTTKTT